MNLNRLLIFFFITFFGLSVNGQEKLYSNTIISINHDSLKSIRVFRYRFFFEWDCFHRSPPFLFRSDYKLLAEDTSQKIVNTNILEELKIYDTTISFDTISNEFFISGIIKGGDWYGPESEADILIGELKDTIVPQYYIGDINFSLKGWYRKRKKEGKPPFEDYGVGYYINNYNYSKSTIANKKFERRFYIKSKINSNSYLIIGFGHCAASVYNIGNFVKKEK